MTAERFWYVHEFAVSPYFSYVIFYKQKLDSAALYVTAILSVHLSVRLSVCLYVTLVDCVIKPGISMFTTSSPIILMPNTGVISTELPLVGALIRSYQYLHGYMYNFFVYLGQDTRYMQLLYIRLAGNHIGYHSYHLEMSCS